MSKAHRGKGIRETYNRGRGTCPVCNKTGVKVIYEQEVNGLKKSVCKVCRATLKHQKAVEASVVVSTNGSSENTTE